MVFLSGEFHGQRNLAATAHGVTESDTTEWLTLSLWASLVAQLVKNLPAVWETWVPSLGWGDPLEEGTATHSSILAWRIPWTEEPGGLQSMGLQRVGYDWVTKHSTATLYMFHVYNIKYILTAWNYYMTSRNTQSWNRPKNVCQFKYMIEMAFWGKGVVTTVKLLTNWIWIPDLCLYMLGYFCTDYGQNCRNRYPSTPWFWQNRDLCLVPVARLEISSSGPTGPCCHSEYPPWVRVLVLSSQWEEDKGTEDACAFPKGAIQKWLQTPPLTHPARTSSPTTASPERLGLGECGHQGPTGSMVKGGEMDAGGSTWAVSAWHATPDELHV